MSIDYDRLKGLLNERTTGQWQSHEYEPDPYCYPGVTRFVIAADWDRVEIAEGQAGPSTKSPEYARKASDFAIMALAPDMAIKLLYLRDGIKEQVDHLRALETTIMQLDVPGVVEQVQGIADALTKLIEQENPNEF